MTIKELIKAGTSYSVITIYTVDEHINTSYFGDYATGNDGLQIKFGEKLDEITAELKEKEVYTFNVLENVYDEYDYLVVNILE